MEKEGIVTPIDVVHVLANDVTVESINSVPGVSRTEFVCSICSKPFMHRQSLHKHKKNVHKLKVGGDRSCLCRELNCSYRGTSVRTLRQHLESVHGFSFVRKCITFQYEEEFLAWKENFERRENMVFVRNAGTKRSQTTNITYYYCNRTGEYESKASKRKARNSYKLGHSCTATLTVRRESEGGSLKVFYCSTHYGHTPLLHYLYSSYVDRNKIAQKLKMKVGITEILNEIQNSLSTKEKVQPNTQKDIMNIERGMKMRGVERHADETMSFKLLVKEIEQDHDNPILKSKFQGEEDFQLQGLRINDIFVVFQNKLQQHLLKRFGNNVVCVDSTHGMNGFDFVLITVLVLDEFGEGFPVAWCFSNHEDTVVIRHFFWILYILCGPLTPSCFMSVDLPEYYDTWVEIFGKSPIKLLCSWHVDQNWRSNLKLITNENMQCETYYALRVLTEELNESQFWDLVEQVKSFFSEKEGLLKFGNYFIDTYLNRPQEWAYCFTKDAGRNNSMYLDAFYKTLNNQQKMRMDRCLYILMTLINDKGNDRIMKFSQENFAKKIIQIDNRHKRSEKMDTSLLNSTADDMSYTVNSESGNGQHTVTFYKSACNNPNCQLFCLNCKICIHAGSCTCIDAMIHGIICKHIHLACRLYKPVTNVILNIRENVSGNIKIEAQSDTETHTSDMTDINLGTPAPSVISLKHKIQELLSEISCQVGQSSSENYLNDVYQKLQVVTGLKYT